MQDTFARALGLKAKRANDVSVACIHSRLVYKILDIRCIPSADARFKQDTLSSRASKSILHTNIRPTRYLDSSYGQIKSLYLYSNEVFDSLS